MDKRARNQLTICKGDSIDLNVLDKQFRCAEQTETKYWQQNDAKFRALAQKVPTYEDFKEIVAASHLRPLDPKERIDFLSQEQRQQHQNPLDKRPSVPWNQISDGNRGGNAQDEDCLSPTNTSIRDNFASLHPPENDIQLQKQWKVVKSASKDVRTPQHQQQQQQQQHPQQQQNQYLLQYLLHVGAERLRQIWKVEVGNFGEIIQVLDSNISRLRLTGEAFSTPSSEEEGQLEGKPHDDNILEINTDRVDRRRSNDDNKADGNVPTNNDAVEEGSAMNQAKNIVEIFDAMKKSKRFDLSTQFLARDEILALRRVDNFAHNKFADES